MVKMCVGVAELSWYEFQCQHPLYTAYMLANNSNCQNRSKTKKLKCFICRWASFT